MSPAARSPRNFGTLVPVFRHGGAILNPAWMATESPWPRKRRACNFLFAGWLIRTEISVAVPALRGRTTMTTPEPADDSSAYPSNWKPATFALATSSAPNSNYTSPHSATRISNAYGETADGRHQVVARLPDPR